MNVLQQIENLLKTMAAPGGISLDILMQMINLNDVKFGRNQRAMYRRRDTNELEIMDHINVLMKARGKLGQDPTDELKAEHDKMLGIINAEFDAEEKKIRDELDAKLFTASSKLEKVVAVAIDKREVDRSLALLEGDIRKANVWQMDPRADQKSSERLQIIEQAQRQIVLGELPKSHAYNGLTSYFMYSASEGCVVHLTRDTSKEKPTWIYACHYAKSTLGAFRAVDDKITGSLIAPIDVAGFTIDPKLVTKD